MTATTTPGMEDIFLRDFSRSEGDLSVSHSGDLETVTGLSNLKQALLHRFLTRPGTLIHRLDYGVGLQDFQGAVMSFERKRQLAVRIDEQARRDPRVVRVREVAIREMEDNTYGMIISVKLDAVGFGPVSFEFAIGEPI